MNNFKSNNVSSLLLVLTALLPLTSYADNTSTNTSSAQSVATSNSATNHATANTTNSESPTTTSPQVASVVIHVPVGTSQVVINCFKNQDNSNNGNASGSNIALPNPTMSAYKDYIVPTDGFHVPVITTFCPVRIVYDPRVHPLLPGLGRNITFDQKAPSLLGNEYRPFYIYPLYPRGVNPSRKGQDLAIGGNNADLGVWPNPSSIPANVQVTVSGVFNTKEDIAKSALEVPGLNHTTVFTGFIQQLRHPQQTLEQLDAIEYKLVAQTLLASEKLWIDTSVYSALIKPKKLDQNLYLVSFPTTDIFSLRSPFVPVSPSNPKGYWPNPEPSANVIVDSSGYYLGGASANANLNPLASLIPNTSNLVQVTGDFSADPYVNEPNTGSKEIAEKNVPVTQQANSPFAVYYISNEELDKVVAKLQQK